MPKDKEIFWVSDLKKEIRKSGLTLHEVSDGQYVFINKDTGAIIYPASIAGAKVSLRIQERSFKNG